jgi:hypothetical protein
MTLKQALDSMMVQTDSDSLASLSKTLGDLISVHQQPCSFGFDQQLRTKVNVDHASVQAFAFIVRVHVLARLCVLVR